MSDSAFPALGIVSNAFVGSGISFKTSAGQLQKVSRKSRGDIGPSVKRAVSSPKRTYRVLESFGECPKTSELFSIKVSGTLYIPTEGVASSKVANMKSSRLLVLAWLSSVTKTRKSGSSRDWDMSSRSRYQRVRVLAT